jgi:rod shape determining protein RodA
MRFGFGLKRGSLPLLAKFGQINWTLVLLVSLIAGIGFAMLYSAANGEYEPWALRQLARFGIGLTLMFAIAMVDVRQLLRSAYLIYGVALILLISVEFLGTSGMGAQRWIDLKIFKIQPSEVMKIALVLALARYFHGMSGEEVRRLPTLIIPLVLLLIPSWLVIRQPDLGTALLLIMAGAAIFFLAGVRLWVFGASLALVLAIVPLAWHLLHDYQQQRVLTFMNPERDPLGAGYHILQSKIALGSGGLFGKGFLEGTQSHLNFLPEKQTDFIFTMLAEEFGLVGALALLGLYLITLAIGIAISLRSTSQFGRLLGMGIMTTFFLYVFINIAMVTGLIPVVGIPLPLISYGGTAMLTILISFGLLISVNIHRDVMLPRRGGLL